MFRMSFILKEKKDGSLNLALSIWFRLFFLFIAALLMASIFVSEYGFSRQWIPLLIIAVCLAGAMYEEKWIFDQSEDKITYIAGLIFFNKKRTFKFEEVDRFKISGDFHTDGEGKLNRIRKKMVKYSLILDSGRVFDIDISTSKTNSIELRDKAERIAAYCEIQLSVDSYLDTFLRAKILDNQN